MFPKNPAQAPLSAKAHPRSVEQTPSNRIDYFQTPSGPLRFFSAGRVQKPPQLVRNAVMLVNIIGFAVILAASGSANSHLQAGIKVCFDLLFRCG